MKKSILFSSLFILPLFLCPVSSQAKVYLDQEVDPLPLVDITVVLPSGFETQNPKEAGLASLLPDILESGTEKLSRQELLDQLAEFGASLDFTVSNQYSYLKLSFPVVDGKKYDSLANLLGELWEKPRFQTDSFDLARTKLEAALKASLDSDAALAGGTARRWMNKKSFGGNPVFIEQLPRLSLEGTKTVFERDFKGATDVWAGVVAPEKQKDLVKKILSKVFTKQGEIVEGKYLSQLPVKTFVPAKVGSKKSLLLVDKAERSQNISMVMAVYPNKINPDEELAFRFANHVLVDSGLGSVFGEAIRTKGGFAYSVSPVSKYYLGMPSLGFAMNPVKEKSKQVYRVTADLLAGAYANAKTFTQIPDSNWDLQWKSFKYGEILDQSSAGGRLGKRLAVVTGLLSPTLYQREPETWAQVERKQVQKLLPQMWKKSVTTMAVVGSAKDLRPILKKNFSDFSIHVIPYKQSISEKAYR